MKDERRGQRSSEKIMAQAEEVSLFLELNKGSEVKK